MGEHTPEPWKVDPPIKPNCLSIRQDAAGSYLIATVWKDDAAGLMEADARRIVACVNACKGIPIETLESGNPMRLAIDPKPTISIHNDDDRMQALAAARFEAISKAIRQVDRKTKHILADDKIAAALHAVSAFAAVTIIGATQGSSGDSDVDASMIYRVRQASLQAMIDELEEIDTEKN